MADVVNNAIGNIDTITDGSSIALKSQSSPFVADFNFTDIYDEKLIKQFTKSTERLIRSSREYNAYIELLRTNITALNKDNILSNITTADVGLEFHHYPLSLYDIIQVMMLHNITNNISFTSFSLAKQVMEEHFKHHIGLVPLTKTTHELAHSGNLFISKNQIFGDYTAFINDYKDGMTVDLKTKITNMENMSSKNVPSDFKGLF